MNWNEGRVALHLGESLIAFKFGILLNFFKVK